MNKKIQQMPIHINHPHLLKTDPIRTFLLTRPNDMPIHISHPELTQHHCICTHLLKPICNCNETSCDTCTDCPCFCDDED